MKFIHRRTSNKANYTMSSASIANCDDPEVLKTLISDLESEVKERTSENACFEAEIRALQRRLVKKDAEILRQERELHKLRVREIAKWAHTVLIGYCE